MDVILQEDIITHDSLVQEATREYRNLVDSNWWEPATSKEKSQFKPSLPKAYIVVIEQLINKDLKQVDFKSRCSGFYSGSVGGSYVKSNVTCHKCDKNSIRDPGHIFSLRLFI